MGSAHQFRLPELSNPFAHPRENAVTPTVQPAPVPSSQPVATSTPLAPTLQPTVQPTVQPTATPRPTASSDLPISPIVASTPVPTTTPVATPVITAPATSQLVATDNGSQCTLEQQRTAQSYNVQQIQNPDGTITIVSDNIRVTVRPVEGFTLPTDPAERQAMLDAARERKNQDDQRAYGMTTEEMQQQALTGTADQRYFDSEQHWVWAIAASARTGGQLPPEYFMTLDPYGGTAGNGPQIQPGGGAGQPLSTISMAHDTDWDLGRYFNAGPLNALYGMEGVDPRVMGMVGLFDAGMTGTLVNHNPFSIGGDTATALDQAPKYSDGFLLNPALASDWNVQYSRSYAQDGTDSPVPLTRAYFREDQLFDP